MKILDAKVDWSVDFDNRPSLTILVDELPKESDRIYTQKETIYFSCLDGSCSYFHYVSPGEGFGGSKFELKMDDGTTKILVGPWSSRAGCVNQLFGPIVDVAAITDADYWYGKKKYGGCFRHTAITLENAFKAAKMAKCHLVKVVDGDITWYPSMDKKLIIKPRIKGRKKPRYERFIYNHSEIFNTLREAKDLTPRKIIGEAIKKIDGSINSSGIYYRYIGDKTDIKGFIANNGAFYNPKEAAQIAFEVGQIKEPKDQLELKDIRSFL